MKFESFLLAISKNLHAGGFKRKKMKQQRRRRFFFYWDVLNPVQPIGEATKSQNFIAIHPIQRISVLDAVSDQHKWTDIMYCSEQDCIDLFNILWIEKWCSELHLRRFSAHGMSEKIGSCVDSRIIFKKQFFFFFFFRK